MSRIGRLPIALPGGVSVSISGGSVEVKGPKGTLKQSIPQRVAVQNNNGSIEVTRESDEREVKALHGLARSLIANMVKGVAEGFSKSVEVIGVGYGAKMQGDELVVSVGFTNPVKMKVPDGLKVADPKTVNISIPGIGSVPVTTVTVEGADKQLVGQFAASVRAIRPPEPYKGKGIRYKGEEVRKKAGKAMGAGD